MSTYTPNSAPFLKIGHNLSDQKPSFDEMRIIVAAFKRITYEIDENGQKHIKQKTGKEINVSEDIFVFLKRVLSHNAKYRDTKPLTRYGVWDEDTVTATDDAPRDTANCVAYTIRNILGDYGVHYTLAEIECQLMANGLYNPTTGVNLAYINSALNLFFDDVTYMTDQDEMVLGGHYLAIIDDPGRENGLHSVTAFGFNNGSLFVRDDQNSIYDAIETINIRYLISLELRLH